MRPTRRTEQVTRTSACLRCFPRSERCGLRRKLQSECHLQPTVWRYWKKIRDERWWLQVSERFTRKWNSCDRTEFRCSDPSMTRVLYLRRSIRLRNGCFRRNPPSHVRSLCGLKEYRLNEVKGVSCHASRLFTFQNLQFLSIWRP